MFEGSRPYGLGKVQTGKEFKGLRIINSLKRGKEIIFTATGLMDLKAPAACEPWTCSALSEVLPPGPSCCAGAVAYLLIRLTAQPSGTTVCMIIIHVLFRMATECKTHALFSFSVQTESLCMFICFMQNGNREENPVLCISAATESDWSYV